MDFAEKKISMIPTGKEQKWNQPCLLRKNGIAFAGAVMTAMAVVLSLGVPEIADEGINNTSYQFIYELIEQLEEGFAGQGMLMSVLSVCFYVIYKKLWVEKNLRVIRYSRGLSLILAILFTGGEAFMYGGRLSLLIYPEVNRIKTVILLIGLYVMYLTAIHYLYLIFHKNSSGRMREGRLIRVYRRHPFLTVWCGLLAVWIWHLILRYPGAMSYDNWDQLAQYFGVQAYSTSQPIFHTWVFGSFIRLGMWLGSCNMGLFLFLIFQSLIMSAVLSYSMLLMRRWSTPVWMRCLTMGICCVAPYYTGYAAFPIKDYLYTAFYLLLVLELMEWIREPEALGSIMRRKMVWILSAALMILFRKNGFYVYLAVVCVMVFYRAAVYIKGRKSDFGTAPGFWICMLLPFFLVQGTELLITEHYQVQQDSPKEMFSLPFQQTARYVKEYGEEIGEEEKEIIARVLDYEALPVIYSALTADPVKTTYRAQNTGELKDYFRVWLRQFFRHPLCYLEATWNQNYYVFAPYLDNIVYNKNCYVGAELVWNSEFYESVHFEIPERMQGLAQIAVSWYSLLTRLPVTGMLNNVAFYVILMFIIFTFMLNDKCRKELIAMIPLFVSFLFILLAPQIQDQPRYAFPIIYAMPAVIAFYRMRTISYCSAGDADGKYL